jgi:molybdopterin-dependent oxidoreductase alpha subunit
MLDMRFNPSLWASLKPLGAGEVKPHHLTEMAKVAWENRDEMGYAWRILRDGVCDGCALGTTGLRDFTLDGVHLCTVRLRLLRLNTMGALDPGLLDDPESLAKLEPHELRDLGRIPHPMVRRKGERGFRRVDWDEAIDLLAGRLRGADPRRISFYLTSRGITNEVYYVAQKTARFLGTNHIDNSARVCHAPSTTGMKRSLGVAASTCSYSDWIGTDVLLLIGSDTPNNQPVTTKYMYEARRKGTRIVVVNPYREPGLERYWIPSIADSAVFGTKLADRFFQVRHGGDAAFLTGVLRRLVEGGWVDRSFLEAHTTGFPEVEEALGTHSWEALERSAGATRDEMGELARILGEASSAVFVWSMGITQHRHGVENVQSIVNLALARGFVGRERCGLMPIRGHSGVQGGAEMGAVPWTLPGGAPGADEKARRRFAELWGFPVPEWRGMSAVESVDAAHRGELDMLWAVGGDYLSTLPDPSYCREALDRIPLRVHQDIVLTRQMLLEPLETVVLLPATTRYEQPGGGTQTSTERRVYFSPEIPGRRIGEARSEWEVLQAVAARAHPERAERIRFEDARAIRSEIARANPTYEGIQHLKAKGEAFQWGGPRLCEEGRFPTPDGRARFRSVAFPEPEVPEGWFSLSTRRGKQFNSMVQERRDPLTGAVREAVLMADGDARRLGLGDGDAVRVRSPHGEFLGRLAVVPIREGDVQMHWPEANVLIPRGVTEPHSGIPDFNVAVQVLPAAEGP